MTVLTNLEVGATLRDPTPRDPIGPYAVCNSKLISCAPPGCINFKLSTAGTDVCGCKHVCVIYSYTFRFQLIHSNVNNSGYAICCINKLEIKTHVTI